MNLDAFIADLKVSYIDKMCNKQTTTKDIKHKLLSEYHNYLIKDIYIDTAGFFQHSEIFCHPHTRQC